MAGWGKSLIRGQSTIIPFFAPVIRQRSSGRWIRAGSFRMSSGPCKAVAIRSGAPKERQVGSSAVVERSVPSPACSVGSRLSPSVFGRRSFDLVDYELLERRTPPNEPQALLLDRGSHRRAGWIGGARHRLIGAGPSISLWEISSATW